MAFSGALTLTDLNDFITPSQACIKPVEQSNPAPVHDPGAALTQIQVDSTGSYYEVSAVGRTDVDAKKLQTAEISLNDCLACSGCITSAESVLITLQSHTEVLNFLESNPILPAAAHRTPVLSIAPQSLASLAAALSSSSARPVGPAEVLARVRAFAIRVLGFEHVFDTTFARHIALLEHAREFSERRSGKGKEKGVAPLPMLASACPGWVCYAEKTHAEMLPFISAAKSPQQVMGTLVKEWMGAKWGRTPDQIYHVTVMPCYDKKLEASREDFCNDTYATRDVDCVITTGELDLLMREKGWDLSAPIPEELSPPSPSLNPLAIPELLAHPGSSSGSYLHSLIAALVASSQTPLTHTVRTLRNSDYEEHTVMDESGATVFRGARCYGFRNLQNLVRKVGREAGLQVGRGAAGRVGALRRARKAGPESEQEKGYDYVEVMACPGGCVNGGGQLRPMLGQEGAALESLPATEDGLEVQAPSAKWGDRAWTKKVEEAYWGAPPTPPPTPPPEVIGLEEREEEKRRRADRLAVELLYEMCSPGQDPPGDAAWDVHMGERADEMRRRLFRTQYRAVEGEVVGLAVKW
ncbi:hypothetical protein CERSUDRAFT_123742 [Gelatoporia subvermispora B]|uniref:Iron hydrogenase large subunit C-terminal domain-containing protein n=1 Tax=Ceriporiopsis subvermispora (strain B) TaxID=914234 RepID=M2RGM0_CERS8|nr:hypothetical protein CERSUDRAFT_123742 [Gelatoporia subvermispora B]